MADETRSFLIQFMAETGSAVTAMNWLGRSMQQFPTHAVHAAAETQVAMAEVDTALREANVSASLLGDTFTSMGRDSTAMLQASAAAAKVGFKGRENLVAFSETARKFGFITKQSAAEAGQALSDLSIVMGYETPEQVEKLASGMTALSRRTNVTTSDLVALVKQTGQAAKAVGVTEAGVMGLAASLSQQGMSARAAAVPIGNMLKMMQYSPEIGDQMAVAMQMSGKRLDEFKKAVPDKKIEMFMQDLGKMSKIEAEYMLQGLGIASGMAATKMWQASKQAQNLGKYTNWVSEAMKENTALTKESDKILGTFTFQVKELWVQMKALFQMTGKMLLPIMTLLVQSLRGFLSVIMVIPKPILAFVAILSALGAVMLGGVWAANTKMVISLVDVVKGMGKAYIAVGGLSGMYKKLTYNAVAAAAAQRKAAGQSWSGLLSAGAKITTGKIVMPPIAPAAGAAGTATAAVGKGAATTGMFTAMSAAAAALGVSLATLLAIIVAVIALIVLMGVMIYKGLQMMKSADAQTRAFGATLLIATGPIGIFILGMMALAKPIKRFKDEIMKAVEPLIALFKKLAPIMYIIIGVFALLNPVILPIIALFAVLYVAMGIVVGMVEVMADALAWGLEPFIPVAEALGEIFTWVGEALGGVSGEGWGLWEILKWIGKVLGWIAFGPLALVLRMVGAFWSGIAMLITNIGEFGAIWADIWNWVAGVAIEVWKWIVKIFYGGVSLITRQMDWLKSVWRIVITAIWSGINRIISPLKSVASAFTGIWSAVRSVGKALTGSTPWHVRENMTREVIPALDKTRQAFDDIADSSFGVTQTAKIRRTAAGSTVAPMANVAAARATASAARPAAAAPEAGQNEIKVSVPVTLMLDGMVVGRAVAEQIVQINERLMNPPGYPLRGVEPAY